MDSPATRAGGRAAVFGLATLSACQGPHHVLDPQGPQARHIAEIWWITLVVGAVVFLAVVAALIAALGHRRRHAGESGPHPGDPEATVGDGRRVTPVVVAGVVTALILVAVAVLSWRTGRQLAALAAPSALTIQVTGHQWWWDIRYHHDERASRGFATANELVIPVGEPVRVLLQSADVIHSFWVPNLHGKVDLIPGRENVIWIQADTVGEWLGPCAEFCGLQHSHMILVVRALEIPEFQQWWAGQLEPARPPVDPLAAEGQRVFEERTCAACHTVRGTRALGTVGPDLTHFASRRMLAAGRMPNRRGHLAGWILDPQALKPGTLMPGIDLDPASLHALLHWMETLQ